jgi:hypothetical protein
MSEELRDELINLAIKVNNLHLYGRDWVEQEAKHILGRYEFGEIEQTLSDIFARDEEMRAVLWDLFYGLKQSA